MLTDRLKTRLDRNRAMTSITLRIPCDVVESMKRIAPYKGFSGYQTLLKTYLSEGLRRDEAMLSAESSAALVEALKRHGVSEDVIARARDELVHAAA